MIASNPPLSSEEFVVVHPLFDAPEQKCGSIDLGPMKITRSVRFFLVVLRIYLFAIALLLGYHLLDLAGAFHTNH